MLEERRRFSGISAVALQARPATSNEPGWIRIAPQVVL
jgi:hypothetical protein